MYYIIVFAQRSGRGLPWHRTGRRPLGTVPSPESKQGIQIRLRSSPCMPVEFFVHRAACSARLAVGMQARDKLCVYGVLVPAAQSALQVDATSTALAYSQLASAAKVVIWNGHPGRQKTPTPAKTLRSSFGRWGKLTRQTASMPDVI